VQPAKLKMSAITTMPSDVFIQFSFVMLLNAKCYYRSLMVPNDNSTHAAPLGAVPFCTLS
jgi:hypothetical protein